MGSPSTQTVTQKTEIDPVLQAHLYGGTVPESAMTGIIPAYFRPGGSLEGALDYGMLYNSGATSNAPAGGSTSDFGSRYADGGVVGFSTPKPDFSSPNPVQSTTTTTVPATTTTGYPSGGGNGGLLSLAEQAYQLTAGTDLGAQLPQYQVAGLSPAQTQAYGLAQGGIGSYQPYLQQAAATTGAGVQALGGGIQGVQQAVQGAQPYQQAAADVLGMAGQAGIGATQGYNPMSYQAFMNPYTEEVIRQTEQDVGRQAALLGQQIGASAIGSGAYGGSREAVARSEGARNLAQQLASTTANLRAQGYGTAQQQAQSAFEAQQQRQAGLGGLMAQLGGQFGQLGTQFGQLGLQGASQMGQMGQGLGQLGQQTAALGGQQQQQQLQDINTLLTTGGQQQQYQQALLDAIRMNQFQQVMAPYQQVGFRADVLSGMPTGTSTQMTQPGPSPLSQGIGLLTALGGLFG